MFTQKLSSIITFMLGIYNYIPETNHVSRVYSVAAVLYFYVSTCRSMCAVLNMAVFFFFFAVSLISCFPGILLRYCLSDLEMVPVAPIITGITFAFTFHMQ